MYASEGAESTSNCVRSTVKKENKSETELVRLFHAERSSAVLFSLAIYDYLKRSTRKRTGWSAAEFEKIHKAIKQDISFFSCLLDSFQPSLRKKRKQQQSTTHRPKHISSTFVHSSHSKQFFSIRIS